MAETKPLTAYWMHDIIRISDPRTIGKRCSTQGSRTATSLTKGRGSGRLMKMPTIYVDYEW